MPFNGLHPRNPCNYITHLLTPNRWMAELA